MKYLFVKKREDISSSGKIYTIIEVNTLAEAYRLWMDDRNNSYIAKEITVKVEEQEL